MTRDSLICGDAIEVMATLAVSDPPYNLGKDYGNNRDAKAWHEYERFTDTWIQQAIRVLKPAGSIYVFMGVRFISKLFASLEDKHGLLFNSWITWHYTQGMGRKVGFSPRHEDILFFNKSRNFTFNLDEVRVPQKYYRQRNNMAGANPGDVWQFSHVHYCSAERVEHPTQKPEALIERIIRASSNPGDLILDPFVGSGTTSRVAAHLGRHSVGIDINPNYIALAQRRIQQAGKSLDSFDPRVSRTPLDLPSSESSQLHLLVSDK
jgi:site-specific DNA-methyltransferase (adenine-specific)